MALLVSSTMAWAEEWTSGACTVTLTDGVMTISGTGAMADYGYAGAPWYSSRNSVTSVVINEGVTTIGQYSFHYFPDFTISIPSSVEAIKTNAFAYCGISSVTIGSGVTSIGNQAFMNCGSLTSITIPGNVKTIGDRAFTSTGLSSVTIEDGVETIVDYAFNNTRLTSVTIPASVTSVGEKAFRMCSDLTTVTFEGTSLNTYGENAFQGYNASLKIYVPIGSINEYATGWSAYASMVKTTLTGNQISSGDFEGYWSTYYNSGCAVTVDEDTHIYYSSAVSGTSATLTENTTDKVITAGQAVVLKSTASPITLTYSADASSYAYTSNQLAGVDAETTISSSDYASKYIYTLANESGLGFYKYYASDYTDNTTLAANKAFLALESAASARGFVFQFEETTGVNEELRMKNEEFAPATYYNLKGQKVQKPTKGLYIKNGKKVLFR